MNNDNKQETNRVSLPDPAALSETELERLAEEIVRKLREKMRDERNRRGC